MDQDLRLRHLTGNEVDLRLHYGEITVGAALQDEAAPHCPQVLKLAGIDPDIKRQDGGE